MQTACNEQCDTQAHCTSGGSYRSGSDTFPLPVLTRLSRCLERVCGMAEGEPKAKKPKLEKKELR